MRRRPGAGPPSEPQSWRGESDLTLYVLPFTKEETDSVTSPRLSSELVVLPSPVPRIWSRIRASAEACPTEPIHHRREAGAGDARRSALAGSRGAGGRDGQCCRLAARHSLARRRHGSPTGSASQFAQVAPSTQLCLCRSRAADPSVRSPFGWNPHTHCFKWSLRGGNFYYFLGAGRCCPLREKGKLGLGPGPVTASQSVSK